MDGVKDEKNEYYGSSLKNQIFRVGVGGYLRIAIFGIYPWTNLERCLLSRKLPAAGMEKMSPYLKMVYTKTNLVLSKKF